MTHKTCTYNVLGTDTLYGLKYRSDKSSQTCFFNEKQLWMATCDALIPY